jgi:hypothetical protein
MFPGQAVSRGRPDRRRSVGLAIMRAGAIRAEQASPASGRRFMCIGGTHVCDVQRRYATKSSGGKRETVRQKRSESRHWLSR